MGLNLWETFDGGSFAILGGTIENFILLTWKKCRCFCLQRKFLLDDELFTQIGRSGAFWGHELPVRGNPIILYVGFPKRYWKLPFDQYLMISPVIGMPDSIQKETWEGLRRASGAFRRQLMYLQVQPLLLLLEPIGRARSIRSKRWDSNLNIFNKIQLNQF